MPEDPEPAITPCADPPAACRNALDTLMGCTGAIALIATALSAFLPDWARAAAPATTAHPTVVRAAESAAAGAAARGPGPGPAMTTVRHPEVQGP